MSDVIVRTREVPGEWRLEQYTVRLVSRACRRCRWRGRGPEDTRPFRVGDSCPRCQTRGEDLTKDVFTTRLVESGRSARDLAGMFDISISTAQRWLSGETAAHPAMWSSVIAKVESVK